jgi:hypothetical protein
MGRDSHTPPTSVLIIRPWSARAAQEHDVNIAFGFSKTGDISFSPHKYPFNIPSIPRLDNAGFLRADCITPYVVGLCFNRYSNYHPVSDRSRKHPVCAHP